MDTELAASFQSVLAAAGISASNKAIDYGPRSMEGIRPPGRPLYRKRRAADKSHSAATLPAAHAARAAGDRRAARNLLHTMHVLCSTRVARTLVPECPTLATLVMLHGATREEKVFRGEHRFLWPGKLFKCNSKKAFSSSLWFVEQQSAKVDQRGTKKTEWSDFVEELDLEVSTSPRLTFVARAFIVFDRSAMDKHKDRPIASSSSRTLAGASELAEQTHCKKTSSND